MNKIAIFLNGLRGITIARKLLNNNLSLTNIISPEKHQNLEMIIEFCKTNKIKLITSINPNNDQRILNLKSDLNIIAGYSTIFNEKILNAPRLGTINLHAGALPKYRGGSPLNWQIINGEKTFSCSIIYATLKIDSGEILAEKKIEINYLDNIKDIHKKANDGFSDLIIKVVKDLFEERTSPIKQDEKKAIYWHQRSEEDGNVFWSRMKAHEVYNFVRAITKPYPGAFSFYKKKLLRIWKVGIPSQEIRGCPGKILWIQNEGPFVICEDKAIKLLDYELDDNLAIRHGEYLTQEYL